MSQIPSRINSRLPQDSLSWALKTFISSHFHTHPPLLRLTMNFRIHYLSHNSPSFSERNKAFSQRCVKRIHIWKRPYMKVSIILRCLLKTTDGIIQNVWVFQWKRGFSGLLLGKLMKSYDPNLCWQMRTNKARVTYLSGQHPTPPLITATYTRGQPGNQCVMFLLQI